MGSAMDGVDAARLAAAASVLRGAARPVLFCHRSPDGDTIGAALALARALRHLGQTPTVVCADPLPPSLLFVPESATISAVVPTDPDLLVTVDASDPGMLGGMRAELERLRPGRALLNIDHHASDTEYGDVNLVDTTAASTAEIVYDLVAVLPAPLDRDMAMALLTGIINDTHSFQNANSTPRALATAAALVAAGADAASISYNLLLRRRPPAALLWGCTLATMRLDDEGRVASAVATRELIEDCGAETSDLDGVVEFLRSIDGVDL
nr:DHH family phosphoesterase [Chloroflexota bacterium]